MVIAINYQSHINEILAYDIGLKLEKTLNPQKFIFPGIYGFANINPYNDKNSRKYDTSLFKLQKELLSNIANYLKIENPQFFFDIHQKYSEKNNDIEFFFFDVKNEELEKILKNLNIPLTVVNDNKYDIFSDLKQKYVVIEIGSMLLTEDIIGQQLYLTGNEHFVDDFLKPIETIFNSIC